MFFSLNYVKEKVSISRDTVCTLETGLGPERVFERLLLVLTAFGAFLELLSPPFRNRLTSQMAAFCNRYLPFLLTVKGTVSRARLGF
jgi:hypothetical protein